MASMLAADSQDVQHVLVVSLSVVTSARGRNIQNPGEEILRVFKTAVDESEYDVPLDAVQVVVADTLYYHSDPVFNSSMKLEKLSLSDPSVKLSTCLQKIRDAGEGVAQQFLECGIKKARIHHWDKMKRLCRSFPSDIAESKEFDAFITRHAKEHYFLRRGSELELKCKRNCVRLEWLKEFCREEAGSLRYGFRFDDSELDSSPRQQVLWHPVLKSESSESSLAEFVKFARGCNSDDVGGPPPVIVDVCLLNN